MNQGPPGDLDQRCERGVALKNCGDYEQAAAEFQALLQDHPTHARAHFELGLVFGFMGLFDDSLEQLRQAVECQPGFTAAHLILAKTHAMLGQYPEAREQFEKVLALCPDHPEATKQIAYFEEAGL